MAMTSVVKDELSRVQVIKPCCRKAEVSTLLRFAGGLHLSEGRVIIEAELDTGAAARRLVVLNLAPQPGETEGFSPHKHLEVLADTKATGTDSLADLEKAAAVLGARLVMADVAAADGTPRHDPRLLAGMYAQIFNGGSGGIVPPVAGVPGVVPRASTGE